MSTTIGSTEDSPTGADTSEQFFVGEVKTLRRLALGLGVAAAMTLSTGPASASPILELIGAEEAHRIGLADRVVSPGSARAEAEALARSIAAFPQACVRSDRASVYACLGLPHDEALRVEFEHGRAAIASPDLAAGARGFRDGKGRGGRFE